MARMRRIVECASGDIRDRLWTLYWLGRLVCPQGETLVELGVRGGDSTRALLAACEDSGRALLSYDIDGDAYDVKATTERMGLPWLAAPWHCFKAVSWEAGDRYVGPEAALVFIDTAHDVVTTRRELASWSRHVRAGGCMCFHDYHLTDAPRDGVAPAVNEFANAHPGQWLLETHDSWPGDTGFAVLWKK
jgi:hypothetical protein